MFEADRPQGLIGEDLAHLVADRGHLVVALRRAGGGRRQPLAGVVLDRAEKAVDQRGPHLLGAE